MQSLAAWLASEDPWLGLDRLLYQNVASPGRLGTTEAAAYLKTAGQSSLRAGRSLTDPRTGVNGG